jgi:hypothetical protein
MTHTYYLGGIYNYDTNYITNHLNPIDPYTNTNYNIPKFINENNAIGRLLKLNHNKNCKKSCSYFLEPHSYESMLRFFEKQPNQLKICMAHFGGVKQIKASMGKNTEPEQLNPYGVLRKNWFNQIQGLMTNFPNLYTDVSYDVAEALEKDNKFLYETFLKENNKSYGTQIMFGTDYFMTEKDSLEQDAVNGFKNYAIGKILDNGNSLWDQMAKHTPNKYLQSKYY